MAHELQVEGDKIIEKDAQGNVLKTKVRSLSPSLACSQNEELI
jgi:hypothetical protein